MSAELRAAAEGAKEFVEAVARQRSGGLEAHVRSVAYCGNAGVVAYGMLGEFLRQGMRRVFEILAASFMAM